MLSFRSVAFAAFVLFGYFYFLSSEHKDRAMNKLGMLLEVRSKMRPQEPSQLIPPPAKAPAQAPTPVLEVTAVAEEKGATKILLSEREPEYITPPAEELKLYSTKIYFKQKNGTYELLRLRAISKYSYTPDMGSHVAQTMNFVFFDPAGSSDTLPPKTFRVVIKMSNGQLAVLSGILLVSLSEIRQAGPLAQRFGLTLKAQDNSRGLAYLGVPDADRLTELLHLLRQEPSVKSVEAEIVQNWKN